MPTQISGVSGVSQIQDGAVSASAKLADGILTQPKLAPAANFAGNGPAFSVHGTVLNSITHAVTTKLSLNTRIFDIGNYWDTVNFRYLPLVAGYYMFAGCVQFNGAASGVGQLVLYKNGVSLKIIGLSPLAGGGTNTSGSGLTFLNGTTDYIELWAYQSSGGTLTVGSPGPSIAFDGYLVRSA